jgi:hypothetical protein
MACNYTAHALRDEINPRALTTVGAVRVEGRQVILAADADGTVYVLNRNSSIDMCASYSGNANLRRLYCRLSGVDPKVLSKAREAASRTAKQEEAEYAARRLERQAAKLGFALRKVAKS